MGKVVTSIPKSRSSRPHGCSRHLQDGTDVCLEQIQAGLAWHFKRFEMEQAPEDRAAYAAAEAIAKAAQRGFWRDPNAVAPWDFRARVRAPEMQ